MFQLQFYNIHAFYLFCKMGDLQRIQYFLNVYQHSPIYLLHNNNQLIIQKKIFVFLCENGYLYIAQEFYNLICHNPLFDELIMRETNLLFVSVCKNKHLHVLMWLHDIIPNAWQSMCDRQRLVDLVCINGDIETAKWLFQTKPLIHIGHYAFGYICTNGHLDMAKWFSITQSSHCFHSSCNMSNIFITTCENGHFEMAKWLLENKPDNISYNMSYNIHSAFLHTFNKGHFNIAKWLFEQIQPTIEMPKYNK